MSLKDIAVKLRSMQLYYHTAHNLVKGTVFYQDHEAIAEYYGQLSAAYDSVIERAIEIEGDEVADLPMQLKEIYKHVKDLPCCDVKENKKFFVEFLTLEKELCKDIKAHIEATCSPGVEQLIGDIADKSEIRQYLISRRIK